MVVASRQAWTYVSGVVAVAETGLLTDGALADLARRETSSRLRQDLRQIEAYRGLAAIAEDVGWRVGLETVFVRRVRDLGHDCPDATAAEVFLLTYDYQRLRQYARGIMARSAEVPARFARWSDEDLERGWERTYDSETDVAQGAAELAAALAAAGFADSSLSAQTDRVGRPPSEGAPPDELGCVVDLVLDRVELAAFRARAAALGSDLIDDWTREYVLLRAALAVARQRVSDDEATDALRRHLLTGPLEDDWLIDLTDRPLPDVVPALAERVGVGTEEGAVERLAVDIDDYLTERLQAAKSVAFGPERVFGYTWGLFVENVNLRLIAEAAAFGLPAEAVAARMRRSYT